MRQLVSIVGGYILGVLALGLILNAVLIFGFGEVSSDFAGSRADEMLFLLMAFGSLALLSGCALAAILIPVRRYLALWTPASSLYLGVVLGALTTFAGGVGMISRLGRAIATGGRYTWVLSWTIPGAVAAIIVIALVAAHQLAGATPGFGRRRRAP